MYSDDLHVSSLTAFSLYQSASRLPEAEQKEAFAFIDAFIGRFTWVDGDFPAMRKAGQYSTPVLSDLPFILKTNILLAKAKGLTFAASKHSPWAKALYLSSFDIELW